MRPYILLTPGPLTTSETVKETMLKDWCTWDDDYNVGIVQNIRERLVNLATTNSRDYTTVLLQGSGTYAIEGTLITAVSKEDKLLIVSNGAYGDRMTEIAEYSAMNYDLISFDETESLDPEEIDVFLNNHKEITHVAFVHCETTTGILNPLDELCQIVKNHKKVLIVDAMSSFGAIPLDIDILGIDFLVSSANKCIQGVPGFAFVIARTSELEKCKGNSISLSLDVYNQWEVMEKQSGKWRFTSPTHVVRAFKQALDELEEEGGIKARYLRYKKNQQILIESMTNLGYSPLLTEEKRSPIISSFLYPNNSFSFKSFYDSLKEKGFVIYPGKISTADTFRIGTIGDVHTSDFENLVLEIESIQLKNE